MGDGKGPSLKFYETFMLSGTAAIISKTAAAPIERVKLLLQNQDEMLKSGRLQQKYHGVIDCTSRTYKAEGVLPFWRGNVANCVRYFPTQALNFVFKEQIKVIFKQSPNDPYVMNFTKNIAAGGLGSAISLCFVYSLDYARTRLANDVIAGGEKRQYKGLVDVYVQTMKTDGVAGLYRGFVISCAGILVYRGCYFGFYDTLKPMWLGKDAGFMKSFLLGYAVTIVASLVSYPFDTVRRRMMMTSGEAVKYKSSIDCSLQILRNEGFMSMMKGAGANIIRGVACAGVLAGFDSFEALYTKWRLSRH